MFAQQLSSLVIVLVANRHRTFTCKEIKAMTGIGKNSLRRMQRHEPSIALLVSGDGHVHVGWRWHSA
jgi:hypothetical protein